MKKISLLFTVATVLLFSSCATIFTGTKDRIQFNSNPAGATVLIDGIEVCKTPCSASVKRSLSDKDAEFKLDGYKTRIITLDRTFNAVSILNLGGIWGWAIDAATGSLMKYDRKSYDIQLDKKMTSLNANKIEIDTTNKTVAIYTQAEEK